MKTLLNYLILALFLFSFFHSIGQNHIKNINPKLIQDFDSTIICKKTDTLFLYGIQDFPTDFCEQKQLRELIIIGYDCDIPNSCTGIGELPICIGSFVNLENLTYAVTGMTFIPDTIENLKKLKNLCLADNSALTDISNITYLENLEVLALYGCNSLKDIVNDIATLKKLKTLNLEGCNSITETELIEIKKVLPPNCEVTYDK